jgi:hypothetical protein
MERPVERSVLSTPVLAPRMVKVGLERERERERGGGVETVEKSAWKEGKRKVKRRELQHRRRRRGDIFTLSRRAEGGREGRTVLSRNVDILTP